MPRLRVTKKKKSPRAADLRQLEKELSYTLNSLSFAIVSWPRAQRNRLRAARSWV